MKQSVESFTSGVPVYQHAGLIVLPGGFRLITTGLLPGSIIPVGSAFVADEIARTATLLKSDVLFAAATNSATTYSVPKGTQFKAGDFITKAGGVKSIDILSVDTTPSDHDVITTSATLGYALNAGDQLIQATSANATSVVAKGSGLTYNDVKVETNATLTLVVGGLVYARRIKPVSAETKAALPNLVFMGSK